MWIRSGMILIRTCFEPQKNIYTPWYEFQNQVCPVDHRSILPNEKVIEFDSNDRRKNIRLTAVLQKYFTEQDCEVYIQDHNGRSPHLHVFNVPKRIKIEKNPIIRRSHIDVLKLQGRGLCREIGGRYQKKDVDYYASCFPTVEDIQPITNPKEVRFPCQIQL